MLNILLTYIFYYAILFLSKEFNSSSYLNFKGKRPVRMFESLLNILLTAGRGQLFLRK